MPVTVEEISLPSGQDLVDLQKIYEDAPDWMLEHWQSSTHECAIQSLLSSVSENHRASTFMRLGFNSRLLAAILVDKSSNSWLLHRLCVRNMTRSRGVGGRLLQLVAEKAKTSRKTHLPS